MTVTASEAGLRRHALVDRRDPAHERAKRFQADGKERHLLTDFVFTETMSLLMKRVGKRHAVAFGEGIRGSARFRVEEAGSEVREAAWREFAKRLDEDHDLIDCVSFALMEAHGLEAVFGFDRHFAQRGFTLVRD